MPFLAHSVEDQLLAEFQHAAIFAVHEVVEQRRELPPVEQRGRAQDKSQRARKVEGFAWSKEHAISAEAELIRFTLTARGGRASPLFTSILH